MKQVEQPSRTVVQPTFNIHSTMTATRLSSNMTYDVQYVRRPDYIHAIVTGQNSRENFLHYTDDVLAECRRAQCRRTLIEDKLTGPRMSDGEIFIVATEASRRALGFYEALAFVDEQIGETRYFAETVAVNRGIPIAVFHNVEEAERWLLSTNPSTGQD